MFSRDQRITKKEDFDLVFKKGAVLRSEFFTIRMLKNSLNKRRFAILVSKKISKKAMERNKIKRILREAIKNQMETFPDNCDYVFYIQPASINITLNSSIKILEKMLKKR